MIELKIVRIKKHFKNGNYRVIAQNIFTKSIKYYSIEDCKLELLEGDLIVCLPLETNLKINGHINQGMLIPQVKFIERKLIVDLDYFSQLAKDN